MNFPPQLQGRPPLFSGLPALNRWHEFVPNRSKSNFNQTFMSNLLYVIAVIFVIAWALGFFVYSLGTIVHILLVIAVIAILLRLIRGERI